MRVHLMLLAAVALAGCAAPAPYQPDRQLIASIPPEQAMAALRELLPRATADGKNWGNELEVVELTPTTMRVRASNSDRTGQPIERAYTFADLDPHAYLWDNETFIKLSGRFDGMGQPRSLANPAHLGVDVIWFESREDAETCLDALASLKAAAAGR